MRIFALLLLGSLVLASNVTPTFAYESIQHFHSRIEVQRDTSLHVQETLQYQTDENKHGIYRYIPVRYTWKGSTVRTRVSNIQVRDENGKEVPFSTSAKRDAVMLKIGSADQTFTGNRTYSIEYRIANAVQQLRTSPNESLHPELYWDITGEGWAVPLASVSAVITSPHANVLRSQCFSGTFGGNDFGCAIRSDGSTVVSLNYPQSIAYGENVTVALELDPNGSLQLPGYWQRVAWLMLDNAGLFFLPLPGIFMALWWWKRGRDWSFASWNVFANDPNRPQFRQPMWSARGVPFVYEPLTELTPGQASALIKQSVSTAALVAEITDLARKKYLKIERTEKKRLLGTDIDYIFTQLKPSDSKLPEHQQYLQEQLFSSGEVVKLSALKGTFWKPVAELQKRIIASLAEKKLFEKNPQTVQAIGFGVGCLLHVPTGILAFSLVDQGVFWAVPLFILSAGVSILYALALPARTAVGHNFAWQVKGLQRTIQYGAWREKIKEKHLFFEEVLPFAIALGVVNKLAKDMEGLNIQPPEYFHTTGAPLNAFSTAHFVQSFSQQAASNLTYNPNSTSHGSGSGFSGGFSGGGGGGGGGGSW